MFLYFNKGELMEKNKKKSDIYVIAGQARNGKDTVAKNIKDFYTKKNKTVINLQFSNYIKNYAKEITNWDGTEDTKPRELLQWLGTELIRKEIDSNFFIRRIVEDIKIYQYFYDCITISDARFDIEVNSVSSQFDNVTKFLVVRPGYIDVNIDGNHETEKGLIDKTIYSKIIINDSDIEGLRLKVMKILEEVYEEKH